MFKVIFLQALATLFAACAAGLVIGVRGGVSAALGGMACILPNLLFALRLHAVSGVRRAAFALNFMFGEIVKLAATIGLLVLAAKLYDDLHWPSLLVGLVLATQAIFLAFWKKN